MEHSPQIRFARDSPLEGGVSCEPVSEKPEIGALSGFDVFQIAPLKGPRRPSLSHRRDLMLFKLPPKRAEEAELEPASELFAWSTGRARGASSTVSLLAAVPKFPA